MEKLLKVNKFIWKYNVLVKLFNIVVKNVRKMIKKLICMFIILFKSKKNKKLKFAIILKLKDSMVILKEEKVWWVYKIWVILAL